MLQMFYVTLWGKTAESWEDEEVLDNLYALSDSPVLLGELQALLQYQYDRIDFIDEPVDVALIVRWTCTAPIPATSCW